MSELNSTGVETEEVFDESGEQTEVVDQSEESQDDPFALVEFDSEEETGDDQEGIVDPQDDDEDPEETGETEETDETDPGTAQSRQDNSAARAARLKAERDMEARIREAEQRGFAAAERRIAEAGVIDPYSKRAFGSVSDIEAYGAKVKEAERKAKAEETGKTVEEIAQEEEDAAFIRRKRQEESRAEEIKRQDAAKRAVIEEDVTSFKQQYPGVDMIAVANNPSFRKFCGTRFGVERMTDLYADFKEFVGNVETAAVVKNDVRRQRSTGSGQAGGPVMTVAQKQALAEWNRRNPDLKMTPKEFMSK